MPLALWDDLWRLGAAVFRTGAKAADMTSERRKKIRNDQERAKKALQRRQTFADGHFTMPYLIIKSPLDREEGPVVP